MTFLVAGVAAVLVVWALFALWFWFSRRKQDLKALARSLPAVLKLLRDLVRDPEVPPTAKAVAWLAVAYIVSPIDLVPEFLPIGPIDDAIVAALAIRYLVRRAGPDKVALRWSGNPLALRALFRFAGLPAE